MQTYRFTVKPLSALGTPLAGDTLLGQLCWTLRYQLGNEALTALLHGYTLGRPFAVVSDALPHGHIPLPGLPSSAWQTSLGSDRKVLKKKRWLPTASMREQLSTWQQLAASDADLGKAEVHVQPHNTINRQTGTTGTGMFAPYTMAQTWLAPGSLLDIVVVLDESRLSLAHMQAAFAYIGAHGYGRDASIGLGKFELTGDAQAITWPTPSQGSANAWLTLGPCAPQGLGFCPVRSHWNSLTRFGRHGDVAVQSGQAFKRPVLLARAGSVFWPEQIDPRHGFIGQGLGGQAAPVSLAMPETVHQGYAPVVPICIPETIASGAILERV
ncbi:MAG: hypothetical protein M9919_12580 [Burkholderiaceae bacterium]|jgi:CRISPR-associated protein Csm4|nr:hypothetical protein [Burkholderiaceae bacterium]